MNNLLINQNNTVFFNGEEYYNSNWNINKKNILIFEGNKKRITDIKNQIYELEFIKITTTNFTIIDKRLV